MGPCRDSTLTLFSLAPAFPFPVWVLQYNQEAGLLDRTAIKVRCISFDWTLSDFCAKGACSHFAEAQQVQVASVPAQETTWDPVVQ